MSYQIQLEKIEINGKMTAETATTETTETTGTKTIGRLDKTPNPIRVVVVVVAGENQPQAAPINATIKTGGNTNAT